MRNSRNKETRRHPNLSDDSLPNNTCLDAVNEFLHNSAISGVDVKNTVITSDHIAELTSPLLIDRNNDPILLINNKSIGKGGFSIVYLGVNINTGEQFAVKVQDIRDDSMRNEVAREQNMLSIAGSLIDSTVTSDNGKTTVYTIQKLLWGENLFSYLQELKSSGNKLTLYGEATMCLSVINAYKNLHESGIYHRDIKTDQILWDTVTSTASITDFGLAIQSDSASNLREIVGSYMAVPPNLWEKVTEIVNGHLYINSGFSHDEATEIYGIGTILADILMDSPPRDVYIKYYDIFDDLIKCSNDPVECGSIFRKCYQSFLDSIDEDPIRNYLVRLTVKMLDAEPDERPTMSDIVKALELCKCEIELRQQSKSSREYTLSDDFIALANRVGIFETRGISKRM